MVVVLVIAVGVVLASKNSGVEKSGDVVAKSSVETTTQEPAEPQDTIEPETTAQESKKADQSAQEAKAAESAPVKAGSDAASKPAQTPQASVKAAPAKPEPAKKPVATPPAATEKPKPTAKKLPKMIELGADKCVPCKMMAPIIEDLRKEYKGKLEIVFIDVWKDSSAAEEYGIQSIPTQIFLDENGKEFFRHVGFFSKENILKTFADHGIDLG